MLITDGVHDQKDMYSGTPHAASSGLTVWSRMATVSQIDIPTRTITLHVDDQARAPQGCVAAFKKADDNCAGQICRAGLSADMGAVIQVL